MLPSPDVLPLIDDFDRANGPIGGRWINKIFQSDNRMVVLGGKAACDQSGGFSAAWNDSTVFMDGAIVATMSGNFASDGSYLWLSVSGPGSTATLRGYYAYLASATNIVITRVDEGGATSNLSNSTGLTLTSGDTFAFVRMGSYFAVFQKPVSTGVWGLTPIASARDNAASHPAGNPGIGADWTSIRFENVAAGPLVDPLAPRAALVDTFTRADENPLAVAANGWAKLRTADNNFELSSGRVVPVVANTISAYAWVRDRMLTPNMEARIEVGALFAPYGEVGLMLRCHNTGASNCCGIIVRLDLSSVVSPALEFGFYTGGGNAGTYDSYEQTNLNVAEGDILAARAVGEFVDVTYFSRSRCAWVFLKRWRVADYGSEHRETFKPGGFPGIVMQGYTTATNVRVDHFGCCAVDGYAGVPDDVPSWQSFLRESKLPVNTNRGDNNPDRVGRFD